MGEQVRQFYGEKVSGLPQTPSEWRSIVDAHALWKPDDADGYNVSADRLANLIAFHVAQSPSVKVGEALVRLCALYEEETMPDTEFSRPAWLANAVNTVLENE